VPVFALKAARCLLVGNPADFVGVGIQADRECNRKAVQRMGDRRGIDVNGERCALD